MKFNDFLVQELDILKQSDRLRSLKTSARDFNNHPYVTRNGKRYISFCCNDFLGLSHHDDIKKAVIETTQKYGVGAGASRLVTGNHPIYTELESELASYNKTEAALVFGSGYMTNLGVITSLVGKGDLVIVDRLAHASIIDGIKLSGATFFRYRSCDRDHCKQLLKKHRHHYRHCLVITEHVFSMDGTIAPIDALQSLAHHYDSSLYVDDAHGFATITPRYHVTPDIYVGTFSKTLGAYGGYVCSSSVVINYLINHARSLIYSTGLPLPVIAAALASLRVIATDPKLAEQPLRKAQYFTQLLQVEAAKSPVVPLVLGSDNAAVTAANSLEDAGFLVSAIRPPTVPRNTARLRFTFTALHENRDIEALVQYIDQLNLRGKTCP